MATKRAGEEIQVLSVEGLGRRWRFESGTLVEEAFMYMCSQVPSAETNTLVMEMMTEEEPVVLRRNSSLAAGRKYRVSSLVMAQPPSRGARRFAAGLSVDPSLNYYVPPVIDALMGDLRQGKYCLLLGSRQSGKSTSVLAAMQRVWKESGQQSAYLPFGVTAADENWDAQRLWACLWDNLNQVRPDLFKARDQGEECSDVQFRSLFLKSTLLTPVTIIIDEADSLLDLPSACIEALFHVIRGLKGNTQLFNIFGFVLVGTECLHDLIESQYNKRVHDAVRSGRDYDSGSTPGRLSPFPHDHLINSAKFSLEDILSLLRQAAADRPGVHIEMDAIASSIMQWTCGHKGLTGTCLAYLVQEELWTLKAWISRAESYRLGMYVFGLDTYGRIIRFVRRHADKDEFYPLMVKLLELEEDLCEEETVVNLRDFIGQGVLEATVTESGQYSVSISSPLLRTAILRNCSIVNGEVEPPPNARWLDRRWVILQAITTLDGETMCRPECLNASGEPSEYAHHFLFMCRVKAILMQAYPSIGARVLPEVKQIAVHGKRSKHLRLDTLVRDSDNFSKFGFGLVASGSKKVITEHIERAVCYHELHSAQVFVINFCSNKSQEIVMSPCHASVVFVSVCFNVDIGSASVTFVEMDGTMEKVEAPLKGWTGRITFAQL
ncbi:hypothetical protein L7F22_011654 [Adiantum nelumboides]|nr:hypothetical protein [Adiantum nelumboides]